HFAVLSNHLHFVVEADSKAALSMGMQKIGHSISRRLNAVSVREHGGRVSTKGGGPYSQVAGWLGRVLADRYFSHVLKSPTEMKRALDYVRANAKNHYGANAVTRTGVDLCSSFAVAPAERLLARPIGYLLQRACSRS